MAADGDGEQEEVTLDGVDAEENATKMIDKMIGQVVEVEESMGRLFVHWTLDYL